MFSEVTTARFPPLAMAGRALEFGRGLQTFAAFSRDQLGFLARLGDAGEEVVRFEMLGRVFYLVRHPEHVEAVLVEHARGMGRDDYVQVLERALGLGLLTSDGELWRRQRRLMAQAFVPKRIATYAEAMVRITDRALARFRDGAELELHREMARLAAEVVAEVLFGTSVDAREIAMVGESLDTLNEFFANTPEAVLRFPRWVPTPRNRRMNRAVERIDALIYRIVRERRLCEPRDDLLGTLLAAQDDDGVRMSDAQLRDEAVTLFLAGHETTALALSYALYLLGKHPEVAQRLQAELDAVLGGRAPTAADVKALPFTECVLKEAMRLYPPAWTMGREALEPLTLGGHAIPKGAQLLVSQWVLHRDPRWFPNPKVFDPERFGPERAKTIPRHAYLPFGAGPRVCIGSHFAMLEATLLLVRLLQRFVFELVPGQRPLDFAPSVTLRPRGHGLRARLRARVAG